MRNKRFSSRQFRFCSKCRSKQTLRIIKKGNWNLGAYNCPKCNADRVDSFVLVEYTEGGGCRTIAKKMKAWDLFSKKVVDISDDTAV